MRSITNRFGATAETARGFMLAIAVCLSVTGSHASAQATGGTPPPAPATYKGCVQKSPGTDGTLVISTVSACAKLAGKGLGDSLIGREVELQGVLTLRTASAAASIQVDSVVSVGAACSQVCALRPPGTRGLHKPQDNAVPGSEGGTPGAAPQQPGTGHN